MVCLHIVELNPLTHLWLANSVDLDQTPQNAASDQVYIVCIKYTNSKKHGNDEK